jgi:nucleotide-binding universal stress UspA family protein
MAGNNNSRGASPAAEHVWLAGTIVVGVDGSRASIAALRKAISLATLFGASVEALYVWEFPRRYGPMSPTLTWSPKDEAESVLIAVVSEVFGDDVPEWFTGRAVEGLAAHRLIEESRNADLLVVGSRGHGGFVGLLLGSVSATCAEHAHCPVLVVHGDAIEND